MQQNWPMLPIISLVANAANALPCVAGGAWRVVRQFFTRFKIARPFPPIRLGIPLKKRSAHRRTRETLIFFNGIFIFKNNQ